MRKLLVKKSGASFIADDYQSLFADQSSVLFVIAEKYTLRDKFSFYF